MTDLTAPGIRAKHITALDQLMEPWGDLPVDAVLTHHVDTVPSSILAHLAQRFHIAHTIAWQRAETDKEQRALIYAAIARHRLKGTLGGLRLAASDAGAEITRAIVPPAKIFPAAATTIAQRNAFISRYPQLRVYRHRTRGMPGYVSFAVRHAQGFLVQSDAIMRIGLRTYLYRDGVEQELAVLETYLDGHGKNRSANRKNRETRHGWTRRIRRRVSGIFD